ncbi:polyprenyl synthetase family protein [Streptomyces sp. NPDC052396]|uniref:polyprenyl synthetase family protein n=1 Tax=Streptomyces sp. NPDC052396 TaxID=3365689 RepID=UPI0037D57F7C
MNPDDEFARYYRQRTLELWPAEGDPLDRLARHALLPQGKLLRPRLFLLCVAALGGDPGQAAGLAVALEGHHTASLVHDDLIDGDAERRGRPSVPAGFGPTQALLGGDAMLCRYFADLAEHRLEGVGPRRQLDFIALVGGTGVEVCRGQLLEERLRGDLDCGTDAYLAMVTMKTAALLRGTCLAAALLTGAGPTAGEALAGYGEALGIAFQIRDDLLPYQNEGVRRAAGKPARSDLRNHRPTLPVLLAMERAAPRQARRLRRLVPRAGRGPRALGRLTVLLRELGALDGAAEMLHGYAERARGHLAALPAGEHRERLAELAGAVETV